jgi:hypothetical protein
LEWVRRVVNRGFGHSAGPLGHEACIQAVEEQNPNVGIAPAERALDLVSLHRNHARMPLR